MYLIITSDCREATLIFSPNMNQDGDILSLKVHRRTWTQKTVCFCCWRRVMKTFVIISILFYYYYKVKDHLQASVLREKLLKNTSYEFFLQVVFKKLSIVFILTICFMHLFESIHWHFFIISINCSMLVKTLYDIKMFHESET